MADNSSVCTGCGKPIPQWSIAGNCPVCLMGGSPPKKEPPSRNEALPQEVIGGWEIGERIGEGAFGVVYAVRQSVPVRREAAMKILRPAMGSKQTLARFEVERQALALMNHTDIVTIFDAGTTDDGRPFYVMEYVDGEPVTEFSKTLSTDERLTLFDRICAVVEHAHLRGVIHRDLKPANILVYRGIDEEIVVKLLDFGIAKATEDVLTQSTLITTEGQILGTPEYMSPEQAAGTEVDTRSDVYSLGVILYELLTGRLPFHLESNSLEAVIDFLEKVKNETPKKPSTISSEQLPPDLDWITCKAIESICERRYGSVREIRDDIQRFRENRSISARPPEFGYLMQKFFLRHWKAAIFAALMAVSVISATVISSIMAVRASEASRETADAYSSSDLRSAVTELSREQIPQSIAFLIRALRTKPENPEATQLLRSMIDSYEFPVLSAKTRPGKLNVNAAHFLRNGNETAIVTENGFVKWESLLDSPLSFPAIRVGGSHHIAVVAPSEKWLAIGQLQGGIRLVDLENHSLQPLTNSESKATKGITDLAFSKSDSLLAASGSDGITHLWEVNSGEKKWSYTNGGTPSSLAISDAEQTLVAGLRNGILLVHDIETGDLIGPSRKMAAPISEIIQVSETEFVVCQESGRTSIHAFADGRELSNGPNWAGEISATLFDEVRNVLVIGTDREILVWPINGDPPARRKIRHAPQLLAIHPNEQILAIGSDSDGIQLWNFSQNRMLTPQLPRSRNPIALKFSEDGKTIFLATREGILLSYDRGASLRSEKETKSTSSPPPLPEPWQSVRSADQIGSIDFSSSLENLPASPPRAFGQRGDFIFAAYRDGNVLIWDQKSGETLQRIEATEKNVLCLDLSPDGEWLVFGDRFGKAAVLNLPTGKRKPFTLNHDRAISSISVDPVEKRIATASFSGIIKLWDLETGKLISNDLRHETRGIPTKHYCRFSPCGKRLLTWGTNHTSIRVWNSETGAPIGLPIQSSEQLVVAKFHPDSSDAIFTANLLDSGIFRFELRSAKGGIPISVPIQGKAIVEPSEMSFPSVEPFTPEELSKLESQVGLRLDPTGFTEILID